MNNTRIVGRRYQLIEELGKNNWSRTYLAKDIAVRDSPRCVVQEFQIEAGERVFRQDVQTRYANETYLWQKLAFDPQTPRVLVCFEEDNILYLVREYIAGQNLARRLERDGLLHESEAIGLLRDVLTSLSAIHQQGIIHNDLKPSNLIVRQRDGRVSIIGFSAIKAISDPTIVRHKTPELTELANEYYPSNVSGIRITPSRDIYALGAIAIEALTGKKPRQIPPHFPAKTVLARANCQISFKLVGIIERMMSLDPANNYTSAEEVIRDLDTVKPAPADFNLLKDPIVQSTNISSLQDRPRLDQESPTKTRFKRFKLPPRLLLAATIGILLLAAIAEVAYPILRPRYYCYRGDITLDSEQPSEALDTFQQAINLNSQSVCGWLGKARALYGLERYRAALAAYDRIDRLKPNLVATWQGRGEVLYRLERFEAANTAYNKTLKMQPDNAEVWNRKGKALYKLELYREALAAQEKALKFKPDSATAHSDRGIALIGMGKFQEALEAFDIAQTIDPLDPKLWQNKALVLQYLNRSQESSRLYQEALEAYQRSIQENPQNITAILDKANVLSKLQQHESALVTYEQAISVNEDSHLAWLGKGNALFALRRYEESLAAFDRTVMVQHKSYISWHNRGSLLRDGLKNLPEAIESYDRSLAINPNFYHAWRDRGIALSQNQQHQKALESFKKALSIKPRDYKSWVGRGIALSSLGKIEEAISVFDRAVEIQPNDPFVWMNRGVVLETANRYTEACDAYREVKKINPGFSPAIAKIQQLNCRQ